MRYRSDKHLTQDMFFPYNLTVIALESIGGERGALLANNIRNLTQEYMKQYGNSSIHKIAKRVEGVTINCFKNIVDKRTLNGHKFILILHSVAELIVEENIWLPEFIEDIFEPFLELESQEKMEEKDWVKLKASADKQAKKIVQSLQNQGYFVNKK